MPLQAPGRSPLTMTRAGARARLAAEDPGRGHQLALRCGASPSALETEVLRSGVRSFCRAAAVLAAGAVILAFAASPARAAPSSYVALGDSYSSGTGTGTYLQDGTSCQRSVRAYPSLVASSRGMALNFRACSGATVADVTRVQLSALRTGTAHVSVSVGGNDAGFAAVLTECAKPAWASNCNGAVDGAQSIINARLPGRLSSLYAAIRSRAPRARVVVVGYPRLFNGEDCNLLTWFSPGEASRLNATSDLLNTKIRAAARGAGFTFSSPTSTFRGHAVCDDPEWINGLSRPISESFHPNRLGQSAGYAPLVGTALAGPPVLSTAQTTQQALASTTRLTEQQRRHAVVDQTIRPQEFRVPDLSSPPVERAAERAGVDLRSRASIDAVDRTYAAKQARARGSKADQ
ncbi:hypothetical protein GCM10009616_15130 [Microlunatus lacustris]